MKKMTAAFYIVGIVVVVLMILGSGYVLYEFFSLKARVHQLEGFRERIERLEKPETPTSEGQDIAGSAADQQVIEFFKEEASQYREFIQQEEQFVIWLVALIGSLGVGVLGFLGVKSKKDLESLLNEQYDEDIKNRISFLLTGTEGKMSLLNYLQYSAKREREMKKKKVLFAVGEHEKTEDMEDIRQFLEDECYGVSDKVVVLEQAAISKEIEDYDIIAFSVPVLERGLGKSDDEIERFLYPTLSRACLKTKKYCVLYTPPGQNLMSKHFDNKYTTTVNFHAKLRETLYMLLYFAPKD